MDTFAAIRACSIALLAGVVLQAEGVSAGLGRVIDWREVKSGEVIQTESDPFDTAQLFVALVGPGAALAAATLDADIDPAAPVPDPAPRVFAFMEQACGGRLRSFDAGPFSVMVQAHADDAAQAAFTERLAELAQEVV